MNLMILYDWNLDDTQSWFEMKKTTQLLQKVGKQHSALYGAK